MTNNAIGLHCVSSKGNIPKCQSHIQRGLHGTVLDTEKATTLSAATSTSNTSTQTALTGVVELLTSVPLLLNSLGFTESKLQIGLIQRLMGPCADFDLVHSCHNSGVFGFWLSFVFCFDKFLVVYLCSVVLAIFCSVLCIQYRSNYVAI